MRLPKSDAASRVWEQPREALWHSPVCAYGAGMHSLDRFKVGVFATHSQPGG